MKQVKLNLAMWAALGLAACGGGGGGSSGGGSAGSAPTASGGAASAPVVVAPAYPASGAYAPVFTVRGSSVAPSMGLSLVHPSEPSVEHVIEDRDPITDTFMLYSGTVNASAGRVENLKPHALLYIAGGQIRRVALEANGTAPTGQVKVTPAGSACGFMPSATSINYANPDATSVFLSTPNEFGDCEGREGNQVVLTYDAAAGNLKTSLLVGGGMFQLRDPATLAPAYSLQQTSLVVDGKVFPLVTSPAGSPARRFRTMVASAPGLALMDVGTSDTDSQLALVDAVNRSSQEFGTALTGGGYWQLIGHDATAFYVYRSGTSLLSSWSVVKITKKQPVATRLASGTGVAGAAAMGDGVLYLTVHQMSQNKLYSVAKATGAMVDVVSSDRTSVATVLASAHGVHLLWITDNPDTAPTYRIELIDETTKRRASAANAMPLAMVEPTTINPFRSENRTRFVYASGLGAQGFAGASISSFDASAPDTAPLALGQLPAAATFAGTSVFAYAPLAIGNVGAGYVISSSNGNFVAGGAKAFSFKADTANSLVFTSTTKR